MSKKKPKKKEDKKLKASKENSEEVKSNEENPFDFGGLPDRNLKKNLGCG